MKYDVTALGEALIDFLPVGKSEYGATIFEQNPGGAPANVLTAIDRLCGSTAFIGKVGDDIQGRYLRDVMNNLAIDTSGLILDPNYSTTMAFVELDENGDRNRPDLRHCTLSKKRKKPVCSCLTIPTIGRRCGRMKLPRSSRCVRWCPWSTL